MRNNMLIILSILSLSYLMFLLFSSGALVSKTKYGDSFNASRVKMKIPLIENYWKDIEKKSLLWMDTNYVHRSKIVIIEPSFLNREVDEFKLSKDSTLQSVVEYSRLTLEVDTYYFKLYVNNKSFNIRYKKAVEILPSSPQNHNKK